MKEQETILKGVMTVEMGLGEAMLRANSLQIKIQAGIANKQDREEYSMILEALNNIKVSIGFDCDGDGIPDNVEIFQKSANTSCCRLVETTATRTKTTSSRKKVSTSRKRRK